MQYVYRIVNKVNSKCYIGVTNNVPRRFYEHIQRALRSSKESCPILGSAIRKYGKDSFSYEILYQTEDREEALEAEVLYIKIFDSFLQGYNASAGGEGLTGGVPWNKGSKGLIKPNKTSFKVGQFSGETHPKSKLSDAERHLIWRRWKEGGESAKALAEEFGVNVSTIHRIKRFIEYSQTGWA